MRQTMEAKRSDERGVAMILALMILVLLTIMAMGAMVTARRSIEISGNSRYNMNAFYAADSGLNRAIQDSLAFYEKNNGFTTGSANMKFGYNLAGSFTGQADSGDDTAPAGDGGRTLSWAGLAKPTLSQWKTLANVFTLDAYNSGANQFYAAEERCYGEMVDDLCHGIYYEVWYHKIGSGLGVKVLSLAKYNDDDDPDNDRIDAAIEYTVKITVNSPCNNAIFSSSAAIGSAINGNIKVHGGLNVQCKDAVPADCAANYTANCEAGDFGGGTEITNNYDSETGSGTPPSFIEQNKIDALNYNDDGVETLNAKVAIQNCGVKTFGGTANFGTEDAPMDMVIVDGGIGNDYGVMTTDAGMMSRIHSTEDPVAGPGSYYEEMGGESEFTKIYKEPYDPADPFSAEGKADDGANLDNNTDTANGPASPWCNITTTGAAMYIPAGCSADVTTCQIYTIPGTTGGANPRPARIVTNADMVFDFSACTGGASITGNVEYDGKGTFFYGKNNVTFDGNLKTVGSFPSADAIAFMTAGEMMLGPGAQSELMGIFYAQTKTTVNKQTQIAGLLYTADFAVGANVPEFFQVPNLAGQAPEAFGKICNENERLQSGGWRMVY